MTLVPDLRADEDAIRACAAALRAASAQVDDLGSFVAGRARLGDWYGLGAAAYRSSIAPLGRTADAMSLALRAVARRIDEHADAIAALRRRRDLLADQDEVDAWVAEVRAEEAEMAAAFDRVLTLEQVEDRYVGRADPADEALASRRVGGTPGEVRDWWDGLTRAQRLAVVVAAPGLVGNLDGVPARDRHRANTVALDRDLADPDFPWAANARAADEARGLLGPDLAQVLAYDPAAFGGDGRVAISAGDLDTADNVAVLVPGMGTDATSAPDYAGRALTLHEAAGVLDPDQTNATLSWIGYDAPDPPQAVREDLAAAGGAELDHTVDGLRAGREGPPAHLTVIGYSYGSTTLGHGAHDHGLAVDDLVAVGSPGLGGDVDHAGDLGVDPAHVWAGADSHDPVADLGNHGSFHLERFGGLGLGDDPVEDTFGAQRFRAESTSRGTGGPFADHLRYFDHDTESLANLTRIVGGDYDRVELADQVHDPWFGAPVDPEADRAPTSPDTDGRP